MAEVIDLEEARLLMAVKKGYRNWRKGFEEEFGTETRLSQISWKTLSYLALGSIKASFYLHDLIMSHKNMGSGLDFKNLSSTKKMAVVDQYLFLLDRMRFECMKRLGWLESYPGENLTLVELVTKFDDLAPTLQARIPLLSKNHPDYEQYLKTSTFDREAFIRKLIPKALSEIQDSSTTL